MPPYWPWEPHHAIGMGVDSNHMSMSPSETVPLLLSFGAFCLKLEDLPLEERMPHIERFFSHCTAEQKASLVLILYPLAKAKGLV